VSSFERPAAGGDHGEAFCEHGEIGRSIFIYDTTLRVPWMMMGPGIAARPDGIADPVCLIDVAPTALVLLGTWKIDAARSRNGGQPHGEPGLHNADRARRRHRSARATRGPDRVPVHVLICVGIRDLGFGG
jgi:arylsulfatase A-like enzyme